MTVEDLRQETYELCWVF